MTLDILKVSFAVLLAGFFEYREVTMVIAGLSAALGHCFPLFAHFKGGKAVATMYGFLFGMGLFGGYGLILFFVPLITFLIVLYLGKIIALASIASAVAVTGYLYFISGASLMFVAAGIFTVVIIVRHKKNLIRIKNHEVSLAEIGSFVYCPVSADIESAAEDVIYDLVSGTVPVGICGFIICLSRNFPCIVESSDERIEDEVVRHGVEITRNDDRQSVFIDFIQFSQDHSDGILSGFES